MSHKSWISIPTIIMLLLFNQGQVNAADALAQGLKHYEAGRYHHALVFFSQATGQAPGNALAHYYLANSMVHMDMHQEAAAEYELAYRLNPRSDAGEFSRKALIAYRRPVPEDLRLDNAITGGASNRERQSPSAEPTTATTRPVDRIGKTRSLIRRQAAYEKAKHSHVGESLAASAFQQAEVESKRIREEASQDIQSVMQPPMVTSRGRVGAMPFWSPELARARAEEIRRSAEEAARRTQMRAESKASEHRLWSRERQIALDEVVANLETQLEEPLGISGVKLQPIGTDLYVRYYGNKRAATQLPKVRPAVARIVEHRARQLTLDIETLEKTRPEEVGHGKLRYTRSVRGKVLK